MLVRQCCISAECEASVVAACREIERVSGEPLRSSAGDERPDVVFFDEFGPRLVELMRLWRSSDDAGVLMVHVGARLPPSSVFWTILKLGALDVLRWSGTRDAKSIVLRLERWKAIESHLHSKLVAQNLIGRSPLWRKMLRQLIEVASFSDAAVLLMGQSGTGKELCARLVHGLDPRAKRGDLIVLDCTTVTPSLSGSEFFGHERGAFTGAVATRDGAFAQANGGTLFLDEVGELPLALQAELLRVIQEGAYKRVGGNTWFKTRFRLVCATNRDLQEEVRRGRFRQDLYYRIAANVIHLPTLNERRQDILEIFRHFYTELSGVEEVEFDEAVSDYLRNRAYPGNVRDLRQLAVRICARHVSGGPITVGDIPVDERPTDDLPSVDWCSEGILAGVRAAVDGGVGLREVERTLKDMAVDMALSLSGGSIHGAAMKLRVTPRAIQLRLQERRSEAAGESDAGRETSGANGPGATGESEIPEGRATA